jgi:hypothetical protein
MVVVFPSAGFGGAEARGPPFRRFTGRFMTVLCGRDRDLVRSTAILTFY